MSANLVPQPIWRLYDNVGALSVGGLVYTYQAGTTTPQPTYTDSTGTTPNTNPIVTNSRGEFQMWLGAGLSYKLIAKDASGNTLWTADNVESVADAVAAFQAALAAIGGSALVGTSEVIPGSPIRTVQAKLRDIISVAGMTGDDPTGVTDCTAAFNLATQSSASWTSALQYDIFVPSGVRKVLGTVYVRKGQTLRGAGLGCEIVCTGTPASTPNFLMGEGTGGADPGGSPVKITDLFTLGGSASDGVIRCTAAGFEVSSVFLSSPGIGLNLVGCADGVISNVQIDQGLNGIIMSGCQNIQVSDFDIFNANYGITFSNATHDVTISDGIIEYSQFASVLFSSGSSAIQGIVIDGVKFTMNAQYGTFVGFINVQSSSSDLLCTGCSFRNMYKWAINHSAGTGNMLTFVGCVFDGNRTTSAYTQSTTAMALNTVVSGSSTYDFSGCEFRNLLGEIATLYGGMTQLKIHGGLVVNCPQTRLNIQFNDYPKISIKGISGFAAIANTGSAQAIVLPYWSASTVWKVTVKGNTQSSGNAAYAAAEEAAYTVAYQFSGSGNTYVDKALIWQTPNRANPGQLGAAVCFGTAPGGAASQAGVVSSGTICVSVATASASNFDWYAETGT